MIRNAILAFVGFVVCGFLSVSTALTRIANSDFVNRVIKSEQIGETGYNIYLFERSGGATTDFSYQISIVPQRTELENMRGNVCVTKSANLRYEIIDDKTINIIYEDQLIMANEVFKEFSIKYIKM